MEKATHGYGIYWRIWFILLIVTLVMVFIDRPAALALRGDQPLMPEGALIFILVLAMLFKAVLIASYFMHLRFERLFLQLSVLIGLLINGAILYFLILPDGLRVLELSGQ
jgi:cytochrome c oxidase subunit IV